MHTIPSIALVRVPLWLRWFIGSLAAIAAALLLMIAGVGKMINNWHPLLFGAMVGGLFGLFTGTVQALLLKKQMLLWKYWTTATTAAWMIFWSLNMAGCFGRGTGVPEKVGEGIIHGLLFGTILGLLQSLCFTYRRRSVQWLMLNILIWSSSAALADGFKAAFNWQGPTEFIIALPLAALLSGIGMQRVLK